MTEPSPHRGLSDPNAAVICAFRLAESGRELSGSDLDAALDERLPVWIHCNIGHSGLVEWLGRHRVLPPASLRVFADRETRHRLEFHDDGFLMVTSDFVYEEDSDPSEVGPIWIWVAPAVVVTARLHPLRTTDTLRVMARNGLAKTGTMSFFVEFLHRQIDDIERISHGVGVELDRIEDQILKERVLSSRATIGRLRRHSTAIRRHFRPGLVLLHRLAGRPLDWMDQEHSHALKVLAEDLAYLVDESSHQLDAAKLLQEELSARDAESTGRNLYVLTIYTAAFLPMTLISGIFGMNLQGMPWSGHPAGFWWVMAMIVASGLSVLLVSFRRFL